VRILLTTEGTYPSVMGGVSTWVDQLIRGMEEQSFHVLEVTGPRPAEAAYPLPGNVERVETPHLWTPRGGRALRSAGGGARAFDAALEALLRFADDDLDSFAHGLKVLARLGDRHDLWPAFERRATWSLVRDAMVRLRGEPPHLAEIALAIAWLRGTLVPLLAVPPRSDEAHTTSNGLSAIPAWLAAQEHGVPLMLTEHGLYLRERYLSFDAERTPPAVKLLRAHFYRALSERMYRDADLVVSVSEFNRSWQIHLGAPPERTRVVYNGVDPSGFPDAGPAPLPEPTVSWVGRIDPIKDLEMLVSAFRRVRDEIATARLRLFGPVPKGNEAYAQKVRHLAAHLQLDDAIAFEGPISPVYRAYHAADVVALSSVSEGFPYVAIEAMMCGRPVVATRVGGVAEAVAHFGEIVQPRDPDGMGGALTRLLADPRRRTQLGSGARARALSLFTLDKMYDGYRRLYAELAHGPLEVAA